MSATPPTTTWYNNPRTELTSIISHCESLKSENYVVRSFLTIQKG
jgi:hypothetical protein